VLKTFVLLSALTTFAFVRPAAPSPTPAPQGSVGQSSPGGRLVLKTCYEIKTKSCTSCTPQVYDDDECKRDNNGPYSGCVIDVNECDNDARCDADSGSGHCD
jgi:hypothetical protein